MGDFGQALFLSLCHEDVVLTRKSHNCTGTTFIQGDTRGGLKLIEQTLQLFTISVAFFKAVHFDYSSVHSTALKKQRRWQGSKVK